jgi:hypothetical protein
MAQASGQQGHHSHADENNIVLWLLRRYVCDDWILGSLLISLSVCLELTVSNHLELTPTTQQPHHHHSGTHSKMHGRTHDSAFPVWRNLAFYAKDPNYISREEFIKAMRKFNLNVPDELCLDVRIERGGGGGGQPFDSFSSLPCTLPVLFTTTILHPRLLPNARVSILPVL